MISGESALSIGAWALSLWILHLSAWDVESARTGRQQPRDGARPGAIHSPLPGAGLEVRFAAWLQFGLLLLAWVHAGRDLLPVPRPLWSLALLPAGAIPAFAAIWSGRKAGRTGSRPGYGRWVLAPLHGLVMWVAWIAGLPGRRRVPAGGPAGSAAGSVQEAPRAAAVREGVEDLLSQTLEEIMIPRSQVVALEGKTPVREAIRTARRYPHTIYPVYGESVDEPLGVVRILDLIHPEALDQPLEKFVRPARIVPETMSGFNLLSELCGSSIPAALVVDEFGGMAGLITVEDLIEVLVGDLVGEHEVVRDRILALEGNAFRVDGTCTVEEFNERFGELLPEGEYETVAGLFLDSVGRIPEEGDELSLPGVTLEVLRRTDRRILWLKAGIAPAAKATKP